MVIFLGLILQNQNFCRTHAKKSFFNNKVNDLIHKSAKDTISKEILTRPDLSVDCFVNQYLYHAKQILRK